MLDLGITFTPSCWNCGVSTHKLDPVLKLLKEKGDKAVRKKIVDYRPHISDIAKNTQDVPAREANEGEGCRWGWDYFLDRYFNVDEIKIKNGDYSVGQFEGTHPLYEEEAKEFLKLRAKKEGDSSITTLCYWQNRFDFIPLVRRTVLRIKAGSLWFNGKKQNLPDVYINRTIDGGAKVIRSG